MHIPTQWAEVASRIVQRSDARRLVMIVGAPDVGKTTFCAHLASQLHQAGALAGIVDADIGQSCIGPPTTVGGGLLTQPVASLAEITPVSGYFVGAISPVGHLLPCTVGTQRVARRLSDLGASAIVVDTSGLVHGNAGLALKEHKFDLLQPSDVVIIQQNEELAHLARRWQRTSARVHLIEASPAVSPRSPGQRRAYRAERFGNYFAGAKPISLSMAKISLRNTWLHGGRELPLERLQALGHALNMPLLYGEQHADQVLAVTGRLPSGHSRQALHTSNNNSPVAIWPAHNFASLLCGLLNARGELLALAIVHHIDFGEHALRLIVPRVEIGATKSVHLGRLLLRADGVELGVLKPSDL